MSIFGRRFPVGRAARAALVLGALVPSMIGASVIGIMASRGLPTGAALADPGVLRVNVVASLVYTAVAIPLASGWGLRSTTVPTTATQAVEHAVLMAIPARLTCIGAVVWTAAAVLLIVVNVGRPWLATTLGISTLLGGVVTATLTYWWCTRVLRPFVAAVLTEHPPTTARRPGLRMRAVAAWVVGTGVPLLMVLLVAASALVIDYSGNRLAVVVLAFGGAAVVSGLAVTVFTGATTADPVDEVRRGLQRIGSGDYDVTVPVFDASELGLLQAGFNTMAQGLRERERLRDLFGRQVGRDVARLAEQADSPPAMEGVLCYAGAVFVDLVGSTRMALELEPEDLVSLLNEFFGIVVDVVERHGGWINKFEGDAALAVFGVPVPRSDPAADALAAARELAQTLAALRPRLEAGIGVSAGVAVAGYVGDPRRYEYTVIGDPVNEAARLSEYAKDHSGLAASVSALNRAAPEEVAHWQVVATRVLRGRDHPTGIARQRG
ncbi:adenylate/guanylate cyclase domain-containing protein [Mycolicibacterium sp. 050232]|uniref:adenylate/guanylate cyclase domain-containing protein n=1 Tax=Mycolicibacterium sp. 050232 TaxID=3113982 RepID=UPI002E2E782C|nr:adenylate/guanylate cyclase domain-containing protein [Mycolicibacterium sp. 050232]MED5810859.1 adenylate/guanylate cyclase domain-containing protein [Mycolicibacterium sp. 050232]